MIMSDMCDSHKILLAQDGDDYHLLEKKEQDANDISRLSYTEHDKKVLRHFEAAALPAKTLCKSPQDGQYVWAYLLFELQVARESTLAPTMATYADVGRMDRTKDLRNRGEKTVLLKKSTASVAPETARDYTKVELMDPLVEKYCTIYAEDLAERIGIDESSLPPAIANHVITNPIFGIEHKVVATGLMTDSQYRRARSSEYQHVYNLTSFLPCIISL